MTLEASRKTRKPFVVRNAREEDIPAVMMVNIRSLPENYWHAFYRTILKLWGKYFYVAEVDGEIVAYSMSRAEWTSDPVLIGEYNELENGPLPFYRKLRYAMGRQYKVVHLISIAVLEEYRGRGIGSELLRRTIDTAKHDRGVVSIFLEVRVSNNPAIRLYKKFGFQAVRRIKGYYRDGEDAYVMVKKIRPLEEGETRESAVEFY